MKELFILLGSPASGKTTFIKENQLEAYTISTDNIRTMFLGESVDYVNNQLNNVIENKNNSFQRKTFELLFEVLDMRMKNGITTFVDATNINNKQRKRMLDLAKKYNYKINVIPFGIKFNEQYESIPTISLNELKMRNENRRYPIPNEVLERFYNRTLELKLNENYNIVYPNEIKTYLNEEIKDVSEYKTIKVIGDIHSCGTALEETLKDFNEETYYVFLGDFFDRGLETKKTLLILEYLSNKDNVLFLEGNHEIHLKYWCDNKDYSNNSFEKTKQDLKKKKVKKILKKLKSVAILKYHDNLLYFSHAGFDANQMHRDVLNENTLKLLPNEYFTKGVGGYNNDVDKSFNDAFKGTNIYQFHGHRNTKQYPVKAFLNSFNLEQQVEKGGKLASLEIKFYNKKVGIVISDTSVKNKVFDKELAKENQKKITAKSLEKNQYIKTKDIGNGIKVFNFKTNAFYNNIWNDFTTTARGLFMNDKDEIVARGYNKFFNIGEKETLEELAEQFSGNNEYILISKKENGFLGILSYSKELDDLLITSKGNGKDFSQKFKDILVEELNKNNHSLDELKKYMKEKLNGYSVTFEVISKQDKHIVDYQNKDGLYILDVVQNTFDNQDVFGNIRKADMLSKFFNLPIVERDLSIYDTATDFKKDISNKMNKKNIEGYVLTNIETGKKVKLKTNWYSMKKKTKNTINKIIDRLNDCDTKEEKLSLIQKEIFNLKYYVDNKLQAEIDLSVKILKKMYVKLEQDSLDDLLFENILGKKSIDITLF